MITRTRVRADIEDFLAQKRLAIVGVSHESKEFSNELFREFRRRGYDAVPVNPKMQVVEGQRCYARVQEIQPPVEGALLLLPAGAVDQVVRDCGEAGIRRVWLYHGTGTDASTESAVKFCKLHGIAVIAGYCPYMFLPNAQVFHRMHGFAERIMGKYPS